MGDMLTILRGLDALAEALAGARPVREDLAERTVEDWPAVALHELFVNAVSRSAGVARVLDGTRNRRTHFP